MDHPCLRTFRTEAEQQAGLYNNETCGRGALIQQNVSSSQSQGELSSYQWLTADRVGAESDLLNGGSYLSLLWPATR